MNLLAQKTGFWASLIAAVSLIIFTCCFIAIALTQEVSAWSDIGSYMNGIQDNTQLFKHIAQFCSLILGICWPVILISIGEFAKPMNSVFAKISQSFGIMFTLLIGINYFLQLTAVKFNLQQGITDGISNWIMFNPNSITLSIAMLGWTVMLGLSSLFAVPLLGGKRRAKTIRILFLLNGVFCLLGGIGFMLQRIVLVNLSINLGMGGTMTVLTIVLTVYFMKSDQLDLGD